MGGKVCCLLSVSSVSYLVSYSCNSFNTWFLLYFVNSLRKCLVRIGKVSTFAFENSHRVPDASQTGGFSFILSVHVSCHILFEDYSQALSLLGCL